MRLTPTTKGKTWSKGNESDGFRVRGSNENGYVFVEGLKPTKRFTAITRKDNKAIDAAAKRWGVHGIGVGAQFTEVEGIRFY